MKKISSKKLENWKNQKNTKKLLYALKFGTWDTRITSSQFLSEIAESSTKIALIKALSDNLPKVIENITNTLQKLNITKEEQDKVAMIIKSKNEKEKDKLIKELIALSKSIDKDIPKGEKLEPIVQKKETSPKNIKKSEINIEQKKIGEQKKKMIIVEGKEKKEWYYRKEKEQIGPIKYENFLFLIKTGQIKLSEYIWAEGLEEWYKVKEIKGLSEGIEIKSIPPKFKKEENKFNEHSKNIKNKLFLFFNKAKNEIKKLNTRKVKTIGIPIVILLLMTSFTFFYNFKVENGTTTCPSCNGLGFNSDICTNCGGDGIITSSVLCDVCKGRGVVNCNYSFTITRDGALANIFGYSGKSTYYCKNGKVYTNDADVGDYNGSICNNCNGTGKIDCYKCDGYGKIKKNIKCNKCNKGRINIRDCKVCNKTGVIPKYRHYTLYTEYIKPFFEGITSKKVNNKQRIKKTILQKVNGKFPETSTRLLTSSDLSKLSKKDLKIMRNEIFARHGHIFNSGEMGRYFKKQSWYKGTIKNASPLLSKIERKNVRLIQKYE